MCVGLLVRLSPGNAIQDMVSFKNTILLNVLLPPIILNSGYQLKQVRLSQIRATVCVMLMSNDRV